MALRSYKEDFQKNQQTRFIQKKKENTNKLKDFGVFHQQRSGENPTAAKREKRGPNTHVDLRVVFFSFAYLNKNIIT